MLSRQGSRILRQLRQSQNSAAFVSTDLGATTTTSVPEQPLGSLRCLNRHPDQREWNKSVLAAGKLVGFPSQHSDDWRSLLSLVGGGKPAAAAREEDQSVLKLFFSSHPVVRTIKRILNRGGRNVGIHGLLVLLLSRAIVNDKVKRLEDFDPVTMVLDRQRAMAGHLEVILAGQALHSSILEVPLELDESWTTLSEDVQEDMKMLEYGNKMAILGGDILMAAGSLGLGKLENNQILGLFSMGIMELTQSEFLGNRDMYGRKLPPSVPPPNATALEVLTESWMHRNSLYHARLFSAACKSTGILAEVPEMTLDRLHSVGWNLSLAFQAFLETQSFVGKSQDTNMEIDFEAAPVMFHLQSDPDLFEHIQSSIQNDVDNLDHDEIHKAVAGGKGIDMAKDLCQSLTSKALHDIEAFEDGEAKSVLCRIIRCMTQ